MNTTDAETIDAHGFDKTQAGYYRSERTGRVVFMEHIRHFNDGTGRIAASFRGTRNGLPFGRTFSKSIEAFFASYEFIRAAKC